MLDETHPDRQVIRSSVAWIVAAIAVGTTYLGWRASVIECMLRHDQTPDTGSGLTPESIAAVWRIHASLTEHRAWQDGASYR